MDEPAITLYRLQACPFCERVVRVLHELDVPYRSRYVEPLHSRRNVVERLTGKRTVPAIVDETTGVTMSESAAIVEYLEATYGEGADPGEAATATDGGVVVGVREPGAADRDVGDAAEHGGEE